MILVKLRDKVITERLYANAIGLREFEELYMHILDCLQENT